MQIFTEDAATVAVRGPEVDYVERGGIRVVTILYRSGGLAINLSLSEDDAKALGEKLRIATR